MRTIRDSFLYFLANNLTGLTIHPVRTDPNSPESAVPAMNAINVHFLNANMGTDVSVQHVAIDVIYDSENDAVDAMTSVWQVLSASFTCPLLDYTDPAAPVRIDTNNIIWDRYSVKFRSLRSDFYCHYTCSLRLVAHTN